MVVPHFTALCTRIQTGYKIDELQWYSAGVDNDITLQAPTRVNRLIFSRGEEAPWTEALHRSHDAHHHLGVAPWGIHFPQLGTGEIENSRPFSHRAALLRAAAISYSLGADMLF